MKDIEFGPNKNGKFYIAVHYHQKNASPNKDKSRWCISASQQFYYFDYSEQNDLCDPYICNTYFCFSKDIKIILGKESERIGKFVGSNNKWHGFPIKSLDVHFSESFLQSLEEKDIIDRVLRRRIVRGQI